MTTAQNKPRVHVPMPKTHTSWRCKDTCLFKAVQEACATGLQGAEERAEECEYSGKGAKERLQAGTKSGQNSEKSLGGIMEGDGIKWID